MARLTARGGECAAIRAELVETVPAQPIVLPTEHELAQIYGAQVARMEALLKGSDQMVQANALLRDLLGEVRVWGDPEARDGTAMEIRGRRTGSSNRLGGRNKTPRGALYCLRFRFRWLRE